MGFYHHETAIIEKGATIGDGTKIWHYTHIMDAVIGKECTLGQNVFIANNVILGDKIKIQNNVSLYEGVTCENDVFIGPSVVFTNVINPRSFIERKHEYKKTLVQEGATIGANATILCGLTIGKFAFIGAGSVVTKDVPDHALFYGNPARQEGWMSRAGSNLTFDGNDIAICSINSEKYKLEKNQVTLISE